MKNKAYLLIPILLILFESAQAHSGSIQGFVTDNITGQPVEGVTVTMIEEDLSDITDSAGYYFFQNIPSKVYTIRLGKEDFISREIKVNLQEGKTVSYNITLTPSVINLPDLTVKGEVPVSAASSQILSIIDFQLRPKNSAQDMLRLVPGLFIAQHAGGGKAEQIFVRGFDCDHGTDVATYVDGIPVNMPSHGHGQGYADLHFLIPEVVQNMDITKGPYFPQNGDFSTGATVRFNTINQLEENSLTTEFTTTPTQRAFSGSRALLMMNLPFQSAEVNSYIAGDFIYNPGYFDANQRFHRFTVFNKNIFQISDKTSVMVSFNGFGSSWNASGQIPDRAVNSGLIDRFGALDTLEGGSTSRNNLNIELTSKIGGRDFYSQIYFSNYRFRLFSNFTFFLNDPLNGDMIEQTDDRTLAGYNGSYAIKGNLGSIPIKTTMGIGFRADRAAVQLWHSPDRQRLNITANSIVFERSMSGWIKEEFRLSAKWKAELGLRVDYFIFDVEDLIPADSNHTDLSGLNYQSLAEPKFNLIYSPGDNVHFFLNSGIGFHSNDARSVVLDNSNHRLPLAAGGEIGTQMHFGSFIFSVAVWMLELENELVYVGDEGTTEDNGPSRRKGIDFSGRYQILDWLYADVDVNYSKGVLLQEFFGEKLTDENIIPLAPRLTSTGGLSVIRPRGWEGALRYRLMGDRPANELNTVTARGYLVLDAGMGYRWEHFRLGLNIENVTNTEWNEAQFDTESKLFDEPEPISELHFTPGTPLAIKGSFTYFF